MKYAVIVTHTTGEDRRDRDGESDRAAAWDKVLEMFDKRRCARRELDIDAGE